MMSTEDKTIDNWFYYHTQDLIMTLCVLLDDAIELDAHRRIHELAFVSEASEAQYRALVMSLDAALYAIANMIPTTSAPLTIRWIQLRQTALRERDKRKSDLELALSAF